MYNYSRDLSNPFLHDSLRHITHQKNHIKYGMAFYHSLKFRK